MTNAQVRQLYPHNVLARSAESELADDRKGDRRSVLEQETDLRASMPEQRTLFEQAFMAAAAKRQTFLVGTDMSYSVRGAFNDQGEWVYHYFHVQLAWQGYQMALQVHGVVLS